MKLSVQKKLFLFSFLLIVFLMAIYFYFANVKMRKDLRANSREFIESTEELFKVGLSNVMLHSNGKDVGGLLQIIAKNKNVETARILNETGRVDYSVKSEEEGENIVKVTNVDSAKIFPFVNREIVKKLSEAKYFVIEPLRNKAECQRCHKNKDINGYLQLDVNFSGSYSNAAKIYTSFLVAMAVILIAFAFLLHFIIRSLVTSPLEKITKGLKEIEKGHLDYRIPVERDDEIGVVNKHFNKMAEEILKSQKKIEELHFERLRQIDKLVTIGEMTSELAHEINNYSAILHSRIEFLIEKARRENLPEGYSRELESVLEQTVKMAAVTKDILKHSKSNPTPEVKINLKELLNSTAEIFKSVLKKKKINVVFKFAPEDLMVNGRSSELEQVFINLITNAIDAIKEEGEIIISARSLNGKKEVQIKDNGKGITEEDVAKIFLPFFTTKKIGKGSGLGLYIVKRLLQKNHASIECASKEGIGTVFTIIFEDYRGSSEQRQ